MSLASGHRLGPYEILSRLGAGGMGEVYRARDTRLERTVAIKVLNAQAVASPELRARFEREARIISQLQHPNICVLHDMGRDDGCDFLVMEYLEGESLADRLQKGALPIAEILKIGSQIADAIEKAHRAGVLHRDIKPANVMLTKSGAKLLDFGLARSLAATATTASSHNSDSLDTAALTQLTRPSSPEVDLSAAGSVLGTLPYMAPEQLQRQITDARSDIFSFGVLLYEMATGKRAFQGKTPASIVSQILAVDPPPPRELRPDLWPALDRIILTCLDKDPGERFQSAHDLKLHLQILSETLPPSAHHHPARTFNLWLVAAAALLVATLIGDAFWFPRSDKKNVYVVSIPAPANTTFATSTTTAAPPVLSPDGTRLVFGAIDEKRTTMLYVRPLNASSAHVLQGTDGARFPFWSPDGTSIGFFSFGQLRKVPADGGPLQVLAPAPDARGGAWGSDGTIVFSPAPSGGLMRVAASGGPVSTLTTTSRNETSHRWPTFLPDGSHILFTAVRGSDSALCAVNLKSGAIKQLGISARNALTANNYLLYVKDEILVAQPFDSSKLVTTGDFSPLAEHVLPSLGLVYDMFTVSDGGALVYATGQSTGTWNLEWVDRAGKHLGTLGDAAQYTFPSISSDSRHVAVSIAHDIWIIDLDHGTELRLTYDGKSNEPVFTRDGKQVIYTSSRAGGATQLFIKNADNSGTDRLLADEGMTYPSVSADGRFIAYMHEGSNTGWDVWGMSLEDGKKFPVYASPFNDLLPAISPDGKWVAFVSNESGRSEVFITPFPHGGSKWQVSTTGGFSPHWRGDGKELYYASGDQLMAVDVSSNGNAVTLGKDHALFTTKMRSPPSGQYAVTEDGKKFLINTRPSNSDESPLTLVINWPQLLKK